MNEFVDKATLEEKKATMDAKAKKAAEKKAVKSRKMMVQIMNGEFLSRDNFVKNLPFTFFLGFLLVVLIGWGYYAETVTKKEVKLERELGELNSEYFTLGSEYNSKRGRRSIADKLKETGVKEALTSPKKIKVKKFVFDSGR
jgi:hypothetical protein